MRVPQHIQGPVVAGYDQFRVRRELAKHANKYMARELKEGYIADTTSFLLPRVAWRRPSFLWIIAAKEVPSESS